MPRFHYFIAMVFALTMMFISVFLFTLTDKYNNTFFAILAIIIQLLAIWISIASKAKRCHDLGNSGWWQLWAMVPIMNVIIPCILLFSKGDEYNNDYGAVPLITKP